MHHGSLKITCKQIIKAQTEISPEIVKKSIKNVKYQTNRQNRKKDNDDYSSIEQRKLTEIL